MSEFEDISAANEQYVENFAGEGIRGIAGKELLVLTCMDSRIIPHQILGLDLGDVKVIRNAGGQLNSEVEKDIILASHLLNCKRILVMPHTKCAMASVDIEEVRAKVAEQSGEDASQFSPCLIADAKLKLASDVRSLQQNPLLNKGCVVQGAFYNVDTGQVEFC